MSNIRVIQSEADFGITLDWLLTPQGGLDEADELGTAVIVALGTDRLADESDALPNPGDTDRRGWWGDYQAEELWSGWPIGSRLWLLSRAKITDAGAREGATVARIDAYIREALQPFIAAKIASRMQVQVERVDLGSLSAVVTLYRGPSKAVDLRFDNLWEGR
jgi:phage gp46-like protein